MSMVEEKGLLLGRSPQKNVDIFWLTDPLLGLSGCEIRTLFLYRNIVFLTISSLGIVRNRLYLREKIWQGGPTISCLYWNLCPWQRETDTCLGPVLENVSEERGKGVRGLVLQRAGREGVVKRSFNLTVWTAGQSGHMGVVINGGSWRGSWVGGERVKNSEWRQEIKAEVWREV